MAKLVSARRIVPSTENDPCPKPVCRAGFVPDPDNEHSISAGWTHGHQPSLALTHSLVIAPTSCVASVQQPARRARSR